MVEVSKEVLEVRLEAGTIVTLKPAKVVDAAFEVGALAREVVHARLGVLVRTLTDLVCGTVRLADDAVALRLARVDVLVVELLSHGEHSRGVGPTRLGRGRKQARGRGRLYWSSSDGRGGSGGARTVRHTRSKVVALSGQLRDRVRNFVEEVVNLVLIEALAVLRF